MINLLGNVLNHLVGEDKDLHIINSYLDGKDSFEETYLNDVVVDIDTNDFYLLLNGKEDNTNKKRFFSFDLDAVESIEVFDSFGESLGLIDENNSNIDITLIEEIWLTSTLLNERYIISRV